jgi:2-polyprenyl-6-methoxyphenol hydroxylase-like FAD-dependent oxidoreductase
MASSKTITITGGGLAGLSLGIALRKHDVRVAIHEAGTYPRHRVCGEFISGLTNEIADRLGISAALGDAHSHIATSWFVKNRRILSAELPEPARAISRHRLDDRLTQTFQNLGGELHMNSRLKKSAQEGHVWAAGRIADKDSPWIGLKAHFQNYPLTQGLEMHAGDGAYLGITPIENDYVNVCGLFKRKPNTKASGHDLLLTYIQNAGLTDLHEKLKTATPNPESFTGVSALTFGKQHSHGTNDTCTLGDAEWMIPPFTGNGMTMAFQSADAALPHLIHYAKGNTDWPAALTNIRNALHKQFKSRIRYANLLHPFLYTRPGQTTLSLLSKAHILPFGLLYRALR